MADAGLEIDAHLPGGNWVAKQIRGIHEDSFGVFPDCAHFNSEPPGQHVSTYTIDYIPLRQTKSAPPKIRDNSRKMRNIPQSSKMFMSWKIPSRLLDNSLLKSEKKDAQTPDEILAKVTKLRLDPPTGLKYQQSKTSNPTSTTHYSPPGHGLHDKVRQSAKLPSINRSRQASRQGTAATLSEQEKLFLSRTVQPGMQNRARNWLKKAPPTERHIIEQALKIADKQRVERTLEKALLPDPRRAALDWLKTADEKDREVALKFFQSVAGTKLMGKTSEEQQARLVQILDTLKKGKPLNAFGNQPKPRGPPSSDGATRLQHIRLLTADTRSKRWMHTTWHHLPTYKDANPVYNKSAILTEPHAPVPRQFVIHPDWG